MHVGAQCTQTLRGRAEIISRMLGTVPEASMTAGPPEIPFVQPYSSTCDWCRNFRRAFSLGLGLRRVSVESFAISEGREIAIAYRNAGGSSPERRVDIIVSKAGREFGRKI